MADFGLCCWPAQLVCSQGRPVSVGGWDTVMKGWFVVSTGGVDMGDGGRSWCSVAWGTGLFGEQRATVALFQSKPKAEATPLPPSDSNTLPNWMAKNLLAHFLVSVLHSPFIYQLLSTMTTHSIRGFLFVCFWYMVSLCISAWSRTHYVDQADLEFTMIQLPLPLKWEYWRGV